MLYLGDSSLRSTTKHSVLPVANGAPAVLVHSQWLKRLELSQVYSEEQRVAGIRSMNLRNANHTRYVVGLTLWLAQLLQRVRTRIGLRRVECLWSRSGFTTLNEIRVQRCASICILHTAHRSIALYFPLNMLIGGVKMHKKLITIFERESIKWKRL